MQFHPAKLVLIAACILLPACAAKKAPDKISAQSWSEIQFDSLSWKYEGTPDIVILNTCYDLYEMLSDDEIDFDGVLECYREQISDRDTAPEETGPRDVSPKAQFVESQ